MIDESTLRRGLKLTLDTIDLPEERVGRLQRGKVRDCFVDEAAGRRTIVVSDRLSAFDHVLGTVPFKGQILNGMACYWFEQSRGIVPNHLLASPDPAVSVVRECRPFPVEMVIRGYLTGSSSTSIWTHYAKGEQVYCGHRLADGMRKHERLPRPLITPTTKAAHGEHDENISAAEVVSRGLCTASEWDRLSALCLELFAFGQTRAAERGLILVDTKYELGRTPEGELIFIDEIHTPDSSRYWYAESYEPALRTGGDPRALDKEHVRRELVARGYRGDGPPPAFDDALRIEAARRYVEIFEVVTGRTFVPDLEPPTRRIRRNLGL
jgi:phosphoribosylaminoimidazole-succinocarboxamide synthase